MEWVDGDGWALEGGLLVGLLFSDSAARTFEDGNKEGVHEKGE
jgi:hypothetical protein